MSLVAVVSVHCSEERHSWCRGAEWSCACSCHGAVLEGAISASSLLRGSGGDDAGFGPAGSVHSATPTAGVDTQIVGNVRSVYCLPQGRDRRRSSVSSVDPAGLLHERWDVV